MSKQGDLASKYKRLGWRAGQSILLVWLIYWILAKFFFKDLGESGTFGDTFGAINALFTGFAFAGLIITIIMQRDQLELQRKELKLQRKELRLTRTELKLTREEFILTRREFQIQNDTLSRQRFETTFFNLM